MRGWIILSAALVVCSALPASAQTYSLGPIDSGPSDVTSSFQPGYTLYNFDSGVSPFTGGGIVSGTVTGQYAQPAGDTTPYFSTGPSTSTPSSLAFSGINQLSFYWGSLDTYNTITFNGLNQTFSGALFGGNDGSNRPSREVTFYFTPAQATALTGITLASNTNAFELDNLILGSAVPEPAAWMMMIVGFGVIGFAMRRANRSQEGKFKIKKISHGGVA